MSLLDIFYQLNKDLLEEIQNQLGSRNPLHIGMQLQRSQLFSYLRLDNKTLLCIRCIDLKLAKLLQLHMYLVDKEPDKQYQQYNKTLQDNNPTFCQHYYLEQKVIVQVTQFCKSSLRDNLHSERQELYPRSTFQEDRTSNERLWQHTELDCKYLEGKRLDLCTKQVLQYQEHPHLCRTFLLCRIYRRDKA